MAIRASMQTLVDRVRDLIGDSSSGCIFFSDEDIQTALDSRRCLVRYVPLIPLETWEYSQIQYYEFYSTHKNLESDAIITDSTGTEYTPDSSDFLNGGFGFDSPLTVGLYLTGKSFDIYGAAADLLETKAANRTKNYDFYDGNMSFKRSQEFSNLQLLVKQYRKKQWVRSVKMVRSDV